MTWWVQNDLMSKKQKKVSATLNYIENFLILASTITGCISISTLVSMLYISLETMSSPIESKICTISSKNNKYKSINRK